MLYILKKVFKMYTFWKLFSKCIALSTPILYKMLKGQFLNIAAPFWFVEDEIVDTKILTIGSVSDIWLM